MQKLDLPSDYKEAAAIERRRDLERQRQCRIFNAKVRTIGLDVDAIDQQVLEKKAQEEDERRREDAFNSDTVRNSKIGQLLEMRQNEDIRELNKRLNEYRMLHQQAGHRREFDLNDPDRLKKTLPNRMFDDDPKCTASSLQKFDGEDLNNPSRNQFQKEQMREWLIQQIQDKRRAQENLKEANHLHDLKRQELDERLIRLEEAERLCKMNIDRATSDFNLALMNERKEKERLKKQQDEDDNATEIANCIHGDILTENPVVAQSGFGVHRVIPDRWKGMNPQQLAEIRDTQKRQCIENRRKRDEEEKLNKNWDNIRVAQARSGILVERELNRNQRDCLQQLADENRRLAQEQKAHQEFLSKEVYTNPPTAAYFMQFNTTSR
ncbi:RIB43A-like with coiled-coils protein 2 [Octopus bimaculoides]|uniref:RIB43A-like with coiled-coils protein 2 n=1 Tax=Octopus bimaculoides TaxID=37653 RepID=A0A0L8HP62_OCTBM|nr:RIB43A-like with coiled-coils protein 2 [Octopus bimaculoides]|eukprot:XP_014770684.1 PREDICTED: RIB43A-like with coiled-coils protein 2 [Octopus bimaculoides]